MVQDENPCVPSPCGQYSLCNVHQSRPVCSCLPNYLGRPPSCRPECVVNSDCAMNLACVNERCKNPCPGSCGPNAECRVASHAPYCQCVDGYSGDPFIGCIKVVAVQSKTHCLHDTSEQHSSHLLFTDYFFPSSTSTPPSTTIFLSLSIFQSTNLRQTPAIPRLVASMPFARNAKEPALVNVCPSTLAIHTSAAGPNAL